MGKIMLPLNLYILQMKIVFAISRTAFVDLNESSYSLNPKLFKVHKYPDLNLLMNVRDGLQEFATYTPPGPTQPGAANSVSSFDKLN